jgi:mitochondrial fission protein ELM1
MAPPRVVVWRLSDGKRGHERQSDGLLGALAEHCSLERHSIAVEPQSVRGWLDFLRARFNPGRDLPRPDLIVGTGRACHWPLLTARRAYGGRSVCLMRPGLPSAMFDLCIIARHDHPRPAANIVLSDGPLNTMRPASIRLAKSGVILIGGPSRHFGWDSSAIAEQIQHIVAQQPEIDWQLSDSRRTPADFVAALRALPGPQPRYLAAAECAPDWLENTLAEAATAWVTADSVAMLYEALSAGAALGVIEVPQRRNDRITRIASDLVARGWARTFRSAAPPKPLGVPRLDEAARCAAVLLARWPDLGRRS